MTWRRGALWLSLALGLAVGGVARAQPGPPTGRPAPSPPTSPRLIGAWGGARSDVRLVGEGGQVWRWDGAVARWVRLPVGGTAATLVSAGAAGGAWWAMGAGTPPYRFDGAQWHGRAIGVSGAGWLALGGAPVVAAAKRVAVWQRPSGQAQGQAQGDWRALPRLAGPARSGCATSATDIYLVLDDGILLRSTGGAATPLRRKGGAAVRRLFASTGGPGGAWRCLALSDGGVVEAVTGGKITPLPWGVASSSAAGAGGAGGPPGGALPRLPLQLEVTGTAGAQTWWLARDADGAAWLGRVGARLEPAGAVPLAPGERAAALLPLSDGVLVVGEVQVYARAADGSWTTQVVDPTPARGGGGPGAPPARLPAPARSGP